MRVKVYLLFVFPIKMTDSGFREILGTSAPLHPPRTEQCSGAGWGSADGTCSAPALTDPGVLLEQSGVFII